MSNKVISMLGLLLMGLGFLAATTNGCGGGSSAGSPSDIAAICNKGCTNGVKCSPGLTMDTCVQQCMQDAQPTTGATCTNKDAIIAKAKQCADITDCTDLIACDLAIPKCQSGSGGATGSAGSAGAAGATGSAGSAGAAGFTGAGGGAGFTITGTGGGAGFTITGTGGGAGFTITGTGGGAGFTITGTAGTAGSTCATACTKADACCNALPIDAGACEFKADCDAASASSMATIVNACNAELQLSAALGAMQPAACK